MDQLGHLEENLGKNPLTIRKSYKVLEEKGLINEVIDSNRRYGGF